MIDEKTKIGNFFNSTIIDDFIINKTFEVKKNYFWEK